jgi:hypothetical protein
VDTSYDQLNRLIAVKWDAIKVGNERLVKRVTRGGMNGLLAR